MSKSNLKRRRQAETDEITREAVALLKSPNIFGAYLDIVRRSGLVGEERNAAILNIAGLSRLLSRPLNVIVKGPSSSGKNFLVNRALRTFPRGTIREVTSSSALAWNYASDDFRHRIVYLQERNEAAGAVHPIRLFISEGRLVRIVTVNEGGVRTTKRFVAKGPIASISTTTKNQLEIDDETRHISVWTNSSREQTKRIIMAHSSPAKPISKKEVRIWRRAHELLGASAGTQVTLPAWFAQIAEAVYDRDVRVRRYFPAFVTACKAVSLFRVFQKQGAIGIKKAEIKVDFIDFAIAAILFEPVFVESIHRGDDKNFETRAAVERLCNDEGNNPISATDLARELRISKAQAYSRLRRAEEAGAIVRVNKPQKSNIKLFRAKPRPRFLPDPAKVFQQISELGEEVRFVHPLTDQYVVYRRRVGAEKKKI